MYKFEKLFRPEAPKAKKDEKIHFWNFGPRAEV